MANDMNSVCLVGRLTRDAEMRTLSSGGNVLAFSLAFTSSKKDGDQWTDKPNYIDCKMFVNREPGVCKYMKKGKQVGIEGKLDYSTWRASDGTNRSKHELIVSDVTLCGGAAEPEKLGNDVPQVYDDIPF